MKARTAPNASPDRVSLTVLAELAQKHNFVNPFIIACGTRNAKFTEIAIVCLQRLIVARALPRSRVNQVLEALMQASSAGLDVQLKILQALPSLLQNYSADLKGNLLVTALNICFVLQGSKNAIVNNTAAATLQQLVVTVFDKVIAEDSMYYASPLRLPLLTGQKPGPIAHLLALHRPVMGRLSYAQLPWTRIEYFKPSPLQMIKLTSSGVQ